MKAANEHTIVRTDDPEWTGDTDGASCLVVVIVLSLAFWTLVGLYVLSRLAQAWGW